MGETDRKFLRFRARKIPREYTPRKKFRKLRQKKRISCGGKKNQIPSIPGDFFTFPGDLEVTRHFWRLPEIPGDLAGLSKGPFTLGGISAGYRAAGYRAAGYRAARYRAGIRCVYTRRETGGKTVGVMQNGNSMKTVRRIQKTKLL